MSRGRHSEHSAWKTTRRYSFGNKDVSVLPGARDGTKRWVKWYQKLHGGLVEKGV